MCRISGPGAGSVRFRLTLFLELGEDVQDVLRFFRAAVQNKQQVGSVLQVFQRAQVTADDGFGPIERFLCAPLLILAAQDGIIHFGQVEIRAQAHGQNRNEPQPGVLQTEGSVWKSPDG